MTDKDEFPIGQRISLPGHFWRTGNRGGCASYRVWLGMPCPLAGRNAG